MEDGGHEPGFAQGGGLLFLLAVELGPFGLAEPDAHDDAEHGMAGDGEDGPDHGGGKARGEDVQDVLHRGKAQGDKDRIDHPVKEVVEVGVVPHPAPQDTVLDPLFNEAGDDEVGQKEVDDRPPVEELYKLGGHQLQHQNGHHGQHAPEEQAPQQGGGLPLLLVQAVDRQDEHQRGQQGGGDEE